MMCDIDINLARFKPCFANGDKSRVQLFVSLRPRNRAVLSHHRPGRTFAPFLWQHEFEMNAILDQAFNIYAFQRYADETWKNLFAFLGSQDAEIGG